LSLKKQVAKGVSWNFLDQLTRQLISVGLTAVLARLLSPDDYGLVALSSIFVGFVSLFGDLSIGAALIQKSDLDDRDISTSFWTSIITGFVIAGVLFVIAPIAARYYTQPILTYIIDFSAISFCFTGFSSTHRVLLTKKMEFYKLSIINIVFAIFSSVASLILALSGQGVWSLVFGGLIANVLIIPLMWHFEKWRPQFIFDRSSFKSLFSFSSYMLASNVIFYFARNTDNLIVGRYLGANVLGLYSMAYNLMMKPLQQISWSVTSVLFPAFSTIKDDTSQIGSFYLKVVKGIALITFPMMIGLLIVSREFILVMVGAKWEGVIEPLQILCLVGALQSIGTVTGSIFTSLGRADLYFKTGAINSLGHIIGFIICIRWGLMGLVKGFLFTNIIFACTNQYITLRLIQLSFKDFFQSLTLPTVNTCIMAVVLVGFRYFDNAFLQMNIYLTLGTSIFLGVVVFAGSTLLFMGKNQRYELKNLIARRMKPAGSVVLNR
jgi:O-antigen/teichoic acid export membrane protein